MEELEIVSKKNKSQYIWVEKYRPQVLSEYIGNVTLKNVFAKYIEEQDLPHILLYGSAGGGKTTAAKILTNAIKCDFIYINASNERGIDTVRDKIKSFASSCGFNPLKVVILDEADGLTPDSQRSLRNVIETYALHTRFILTCNYKERIIEPLQSRVQAFQIHPPSKKDVAVYLTNILKQENITYKNEDLVVIINNYYPDIRKVIQVAQQSTLNGGLTIAESDLADNDVKTKLVEMLKTRTLFSIIRQYVADQDIQKFDEIYNYFLEKLDTFAEGKQGVVILELSDAVNRDAVTINKQIIFLGCIYKILKILKT